MRYAKENRFPNLKCFVDDGYSGTDFDRPGFQSMLEEIEAGHVSTCIVKDLSRFGRNSAMTGMYINITFASDVAGYVVAFRVFNVHLLCSHDFGYAFCQCSVFRRFDGWSGKVVYECQ